MEAELNTESSGVAGLARLSPGPHRHAGVARPVDAVAPAAAPARAAAVPLQPAATPAWQNLCLALLGVGLVGVIDLHTGADVHVVSLYFLPVMLAGVRLPGAGAALVALSAAAVWWAALVATSEAPLSATAGALNFVSQGLAFLILARLVSRLNRALVAERRLARTDALTGLLNRTALTEQAAAVLALCRRQHRPVALVYLDLDHFKQANDRHGHGTGDELLRQGARGIGAAVRACDIAARVGGDEFVILLPDTDAAAATEAASRLRRDLDANPAFTAAGVTVSLGIAVDPAGRADLADLLARADRAMYADKRARLRTDTGPDAGG